MTYLHRGRNGNVDKCHTLHVDETETSTNDVLTQTETSTNVILTDVNGTERGRNGNVDKCHTYRRKRNGAIGKCQTCNVDETETLTNVIVTRWT